MFALLLLFPQTVSYKAHAVERPGLDPTPIQVALQPKTTPSFDDAVLKPLREVQAVQAEAKRVADEEAAKQAQIAAEKAAEQARIAYYNSIGLTGDFGYSAGGGNCVWTAMAYGKWQPGNPISWYPTTHTPFIGAAVLFYFNHVAVVTGIYGNGDVEVVQQNAPGAPHRYSQWEVRGYF